MIDVIIYSRVSTDEQADKGYSLRSQEEKMQVYCKFLNYNIVKHFQEDFSAKTFDRPQFIQLLQYLKANKNIRKLILLKWDRFSRNVSDALNMLKTLRLMNVEVIAIEQLIDINIPEQ
ncbi:MAG: recombinase family protein, partial [Bacteroidetes bacterium]|nr:recombinase family protein [Bacteroidota bacterium]